LATNYQLRSSALKGKPPGKKKSGRTMALKIVRALDGKKSLRRAELIQHLQALNYAEKEVDSMLKQIHSKGIVKCSVGKYSDVYNA
jgi:hypothetical protein